MTNSSTKSWFGMMDRLCGCSYADAQLSSEVELHDNDVDSSVFQGRSTTIPTLWIKDDSFPIHTSDNTNTSKTQSQTTITPPASPSSKQQHHHHQYPLVCKDSKAGAAATGTAAAPPSPTSTVAHSFATATTVTMRTRSVASVDTNNTIPRQRTSSTLNTMGGCSLVLPPQQPPSSSLHSPAAHPALPLSKSQTESSLVTTHSKNRYWNKKQPPRHYDMEPDLLLLPPASITNRNNKTVLVSVAYDGEDEDYYNDDGLYESDHVPVADHRNPTSESASYHRPRALRRVQTDSLTRLPPLAGYTSAEQKSAMYTNNNSSKKNNNKNRSNDSSNSKNGSNNKRRGFFGKA